MLTYKHTRRVDEHADDYDYNQDSGVATHSLHESTPAPWGTQAEVLGWYLNYSLFAACPAHVQRYAAGAGGSVFVVRWVARRVDRQNAADA